MDTPKKHDEVITPEPPQVMDPSKLPFHQRDQRKNNNKKVKKNVKTGVSSHDKNGS